MQLKSLDLLVRAKLQLTQKTEFGEVSENSKTAVLKVWFPEPVAPALW
jgi:hypothetical protein